MRGTLKRVILYSIIILCIQFNTQKHACMYSHISTYKLTGFAADYSRLKVARTVLRKSTFMQAALFTITVN